jgi:hypothetical protein
MLASISGSESGFSPDRRSHLQLAARSSHDLSKKSTMIHQGLGCNPVLSLMPDGQQEVAKFDWQLDSICLLTLGELVRGLMKISDIWLWNAEDLQSDDIQFVQLFGMHILQAIRREKKRVHRKKRAELIRSPYRGRYLWLMMTPLPNLGPK